MRTVLAGLVVVAVAAGVLYVLAQMLGEDQSTGRVTVVGDLLEVSPAEDWLVIESEGGVADSGVQELTFSNPQSFMVNLLFLKVIQVPPQPNAFSESLAMTWGVKDPVTGCPAPLPSNVNMGIGAGSASLSLDVPAGGSLALCGLLEYNGALGPVNESIDLAFVFTSSGTP